MSLSDDLTAAVGAVQTSLATQTTILSTIVTDMTNLESSLADVKAQLAAAGLDTGPMTAAIAALGTMKTNIDAANTALQSAADGAAAVLTPPAPAPAPDQPVADQPA